MASNLKRLSISVDHKTTIAETVREKDGSPIALSSTSESVSEQQAGGNPFADPEVAKFYRELYESTGYECRHEFDPDFEWTEQEEKAVIRKLDWRVSGFAVRLLSQNYIVLGLTCLYNSVSCSSL